MRSKKTRILSSVTILFLASLFSVTDMTGSVTVFSGNVIKGLTGGVGYQGSAYKAKLQNTKIISQEYLLSSFDCPCTSGINVDAGTGTLASTLAVFFSDTLLNTCLAIKGKLIIDKDLMISGGEIRMQPGSEIVVNSSYEFVLWSVNANGGIHGCTKLWKGITAQATAHVWVQYSLLQDAYNAVVALAYSKISIHDNKFNKNFIGVHVPDQSVWSPVTLVSLFYNNEFTCLGSNCVLLPHYGTAASKADTIPYAGIVVNRTNMAIGSYNYFSGLRYGVVAYGSTFSSHRSKFEDLIFNFIDGGAPTGIGIESSYSIISSTADVFKNLNIGINNTTNVGQTVRRDSFLNLRYGVLSTRTVLYTAVDNSYFSNYKNGGIYEYRATSGIRMNVNNNEAVNYENVIPNTFLNIIQAHSSGFGNSHINDNDLRLGHRSSGIALNTSYMHMVYRNSISYTPVVPSGFFTLSAGIKAYSTQRSAIFDNHISSSSPVIEELKGLDIRNSKENMISCNYINNTHEAVYFSGNCDNTDFRLNTFDDAVVQGLFLEPIAIVGEQMNKCNTWTGSILDPDTANVMANFKYLSSLYKDFSLFKVNTCAAPLWPSSIYPVQLCDANLTNWFQLTMDVFDCGEDIACTEETRNAGTGYDPMRDGITANDYRLLDGAGEGLLPITYRSMTKYLYSRLYNYPQMPGQDGRTETFQSNIRGTDLDKIVQLETGIRRYLSEYPDNAVFGIEAVIQLNEKMRQQNILDSLILGEENPVVLEELYEQRNILSEEIGGLFNTISEELVQFEEIKNDILNGLRGIQQSILGEDEFSILEKQYYGVLTELLGRSEQQLSPEEAGIIRGIAGLCPYEYGEVVYSARLLYESVEVVDYDDELLCSEIQLKKEADVATDEWKEHYTIYPNPAFGEVTVMLTEEEIKNKEMEIFNPGGQVVKRVRLANEINTIAIGELPSGLYMVRIADQEKNHKVRKLVIIKK